MLFSALNPFTAELAHARSDSAASLRAASATANENGDLDQREVLIGRERSRSRACVRLRARMINKVLVLKKHVMTIICSSLIIIIEIGHA